MSILPSTGDIYCDAPGCGRTVDIHRTTWEGALDLGWVLATDHGLADDYCPGGPGTRRGDSVSLMWQMARHTAWWAWWRLRRRDPSVISIRVRNECLRGGCAYGRDAFARAADLMAGKDHQV